jgi:hypothetical protein
LTSNPLVYTNTVELESNQDELEPGFLFVRKKVKELYSNGYSIYIYPDNMSVH